MNIFMYKIIVYQDKLKKKKKYFSINLNQIKFKINEKISLFNLLMFKLKKK